mgnify:CR=1 FL=1
MSTSLLAVLTPYEAEHFFPEPLLADLRALFPDFRQLDPTDLSPAAFAEKLAAAGSVLDDWQFLALVRRS